MGKEKIRILFDKKDKRVKRTKEILAKMGLQSYINYIFYALREKVQAPNG